jgi:hypothetical protein
MKKKRRFFVNLHESGAFFRAKPAPAAKKKSPFHLLKSLLASKTDFPRVSRAQMQFSRS